ncbi:MAG: DAK2 domain-containing protein [Lachnospiraceae bacterium]|uniref:DAK2 domain-containing protein n=1 Tax=Candidatus Weimeria bifida TaxID=2599074 RepID=A0A6N7IYN9_9FIRM|nr:DAK2 domain-containing protein [Candidatus Weimeria bifida]RRF95376.1 MAG: DAK2 domain-containing protein [Lachnospiraceae bacterium]
MAVNSIDAALISKMFLAGARYLENQKDHINELNVFPVPDGDTGTNMTATIMSAAKAVSDLIKPDMKSLSKAMSSGSLRGARGNSGVILSQLIRGFTKVMRNVDVIDAESLTEGLQKATETAYRAVMKPKEGTILTVAKAASDACADAAVETDDLIEIGGKVVEAATAALESTPELLPVLKEAGVVDSGGSGLLEVLKGAYDYLCGKDIDITIEEEKPDEEEIEEEEKVKFTYRVSFSLKAPENFATGVDADLTEYLSGIGDDVKLSADSRTMQISLLTNVPGKALNHSLKLGDAYDIHITNIKLDGKAPAAETAEPAATAENSDKPAKEPAEEETPLKEIGFVAVSSGEGLDEIFTGLGADVVIKGGQTMNPSTNDILEAAEKVNAKNVFILPNNKNIVLAASQAADILEDKKGIVIPAKTIPQGITALVNFIPDQSVEENQKRMTEELSKVKSGEVTYAVRDTSVDGKAIKAGDYMGITDLGIKAVNESIVETFKEMLNDMVDDDSALITIYTGADAREAETHEITDMINQTYPSIEVDVQNGGQNVYYYIVSVE